MIVCSIMQVKIVKNSYDIQNQGYETSVLVFSNIIIYIVKSVDDDNKIL